MTEELKPEIYFIDNWIDIVKEDCLWKERFRLQDHFEKKNFIDFREGKYKSLEFCCPEFWKWLNKMIEKYKKIYIRWNNRSPKDFWHYNGTTDLELQGKPSPITSAKQVEFILRESERLFEDIYFGIFDGVFWIAPYKELESEARFFVKDKKVVAVSQYYKIYDKWFDSRLEDYAELLDKYIDKLSERLGNFVIDFGWDVEDRKPVIIEINPYHKATHPILFKWKEIEDYAKTNKISVRRYELVVREVVIDQETDEVIRDEIIKNDDELV